MSAEFTPEVRACTVEGCERPLRARGYCATHWARWRKYGSPDLPNRPRFEQCTIDGCHNRSRSTANPHCEKHYYRLRRNGTLDDPEVITGTCIANGCEKAATSGGKLFGLGAMGYCRKHFLRLRNRGDVNFEFKGERSHFWTGDAATASAVHQRVRAARGSASSWCCTDCARPAEHWSYDHTDQEERFDAEKGPYSLDIDRYFPRCVRCHKRFDMDYLLAKRAAA